MSEPNRYENFNGLMEYMKWLFGGDKVIRDNILGNLVTIDTAHNEVHEGDFYTYSGVGTINSGTANALLMLVRPGLNTRLHFQGVVSSKNSGWAELYENAATSGGTQRTPMNNDRASAHVFSGTLIIGGTVASFGTLLQSRAIGSSAPGVRLGGESDTRNEWILKDDYWYLIWFYADNASTQVSLDFEAYEVTE